MTTGAIHRWLAVAASLLLASCVGGPVRDPPRATPPLSRQARVAPEAQPLRHRLAAWVEALRKRYHIPGLSLVLVHRDRPLWQEGFGFADRERGIPASPRTRYRVGSLAKPFTALAVMQLEERGALDIDQPLQAYLPRFHIRSRFDTTAAPITLRSMLCHHSGLPTDLNKGMWTPMRFTHVADLLEQEYTAFPPNLVFSYSNTAYTLLGTAIERLSGMPYETYMERRVLRPLGMHSSGFSSRPSPDLARGYKEGEPRTPLPIRDLPAFGLETSAADLGRFLSALLSPARLRESRVAMPETVAEMFEPQNRDNPLDLDIRNGLGWFLEQDTFPGAGKVARHGGTTLYFSSEMILLPAKGWGVAVLANAGGARAVVGRIAEEILRLALSPPGQSAEPERRLAVADPALDAPLLEEAGGNYATDMGLISIRPRDAKLCACIVEKTFDLIPYPHGWFGVRVAELDGLPPAYRRIGDLRFQTRVIDGRVVIVARRNGHEQVLGERIPPVPIPAAWRTRVGRYQLLNPDPGFPLEEPRVEIVDGQLSMSYRLPLLSESTIRVPLRPVSDDEAIILGLGRTRGETLRAVHVQGEEWLRYSGYIGRKIR